MMSTAQRLVTSERLDHLSPGDPLAVASRRDLRRVHRVMRSLTILKSAISSLPNIAPPRRILELGAGDGSLMLRLARAMRPYWNRMEFTLLDRQNLLSPEDHREFAELNWQVTVLCQDALDWAQATAGQHYDLCVTTLFLHHFDNKDLAVLLAALARHVDAFIACEPRRNRMALMSTRLIALLGANEVTQEDSLKSVEAGFNARELSQLWPDASGEWRVNEYAEWPFTHCFQVYRNRLVRLDHP